MTYKLENAKIWLQEKKRAEYTILFQNTCDNQGWDMQSEIKDYFDYFEKDPVEWFKKSDPNQIAKSSLGKIRTILYDFLKKNDKVMNLLGEVKCKALCEKIRKTLEKDTNQIIKYKIDMKSIAKKSIGDVKTSQMIEDVSEDVSDDDNVSDDTEEVSYDDENEGVVVDAGIDENVVVGTSGSVDENAGVIENQSKLTDLKGKYEKLQSMYRTIELINSNLQKKNKILMTFVKSKVDDATWEFMNSWADI
jgi:hypothetical protein